MATYSELQTIIETPAFLDRVTTAVLVKAALILEDVGATVEAKDWAKDIIAKGPGARGFGVRVLTQAVMNNRAASKAAIEAVLNSDSSTQTQVSAFIDDYLA